MDRADAAHKRLFVLLCDNKLADAQQVLADHIRQVKKHVLNGLARLMAEKDRAGL
jgi:hypothetical protein